MVRVPVMTAEAPIASPSPTRIPTASPTQSTLHPRRIGTKYVHDPHFHLHRKRPSLWTHPVVESKPSCLSLHQLVSQNTSPPHPSRHTLPGPRRWVLACASCPLFWWHWVPLVHGRCSTCRSLRTLRPEPGQLLPCAFGWLALVASSFYCLLCQSLLTYASPWRVAWLPEAFSLEMWMDLQPLLLRPTVDDHYLLHNFHHYPHPRH
mmetsp:Transcript_33041/g.60910  ORF Transcript_33041/g.60910 Transcript_33041/m.60910 type:complete len:206 (-) Transcript_33041:286-903(-)